jgi:hypothetical protein
LSAAVRACRLPVIEKSCGIRLACKARGEWGVGAYRKAQMVSDEKYGEPKVEGVVEVVVVNDDGG